VQQVEQQPNYKPFSMPQAQIYEERQFNQPPPLAAPVLDAMPAPPRFDMLPSYQN